MEFEVKETVKGKASEVETGLKNKKIKVGEIFEGKVTNITGYGVFVEIQKEKSGLVHISEISNTFVKEIGDYVKEGQTVRVKVLKIDDNGKIELSMKQACENPKAGISSFKNRVFSKVKSENSAENTKVNNSSVSKFEDMLSKFKKASEEKLFAIKERICSKRGKAEHSHKGND